MRHVVGYHNPGTMGYDAEDSNPSGLLANKQSIPEEWLGAVMWVITKKQTEKPQRYFLSSWFVIDSIEPGDTGIG